MSKCWIELKKDCADDVLLKLDADQTPGFDRNGKDGLDRAEKEAEKKTDALREELIELQERLFAEKKRKILIVLQAMDTGGKDGAIRKVFSGVNPMGVDVARFEKPTPDEIAHDYLWRVHAKTPSNGMITIFNRSHYEDVLVVRVNELVPKKMWKERYEHIRGFEKLLSDEDTTILKFYLHIDKDEQRKRLQARLDEPNKNWKFDAHDLDQRKLWDEYMLAFRDAIVETDRPNAPWYVIPSNHKWFRDYAIMRILVDTMKDMKPKYPESDPGIVGLKVE